MFRFRPLTPVATIMAIIAINGCATTPSGDISSTSGARYVGASALSICPKMTISNAPRTVDGKRLAKYAPTKIVRGVTLMRAPVKTACLSSGYGPRRSSASGVHKGIDLFTRTPKTIVAAGPGRIKFVGVQRGFGKTVIIDHGNGVETLYAHLSAYKTTTKAGALIKRGAPLGKTGKTGNASAVHLHYEIRTRGRSIDPLK